MITTVLKGGLGNQMFQYAIGRSIAQLNDTALFLEESSYTRSRAYPFPFHLDKFSITPDYNKPNPTKGPTRVITEQNLQYNPNVVQEYEEDVIFNGYWQDERYFDKIESLLFSDLRLRPEYMSEEYLAAVHFLENLANPVFVHIRRGERANNKKAKSIHGLIGGAYYLEAIDYIKRKKPDSTMLFFSDDPEYTDGMFGSMNDYEHFSLMTLCKHAIIANSSFSWWAAWLIRNTEKIVVAPSKWTTNENGSNKEIVPKEWKKLDPHYE